MTLRSSPPEPERLGLRGSPVRPSWAVLAVGLALGCSGPTGTAGLTQLPLGQSENPALQQIEVRKIADLPALAIVERAGDASPAAAITVRVVPEVATGLASILAARLEAALFRLTGDAGHETRAKQILAAISTPTGLDEQGRVIGSYAIALLELGIR